MKSWQHTPHADTREATLALLGRALADPTRCRILVALLDGTPYPAGLADKLGLTRSNVSNHLTLLRTCGLVAPSTEGRRVRYALTDTGTTRALRALLAPARTRRTRTSG
ncbi:ArsR/SmtB family transcription factor [Actinokineospora enzanensis]|uniref:ArsR/SmtB family transcription factor n=1 Tax=Actinokineospora enzanensis TaxID=155975 RepID=UPI0003627F3B|nr:metalloregulator ArsR/SmtB family transcription factor [Actinokineospora enzanensis]